MQNRNQCGNGRRTSLKPRKLKKAALPAALAAHDRAQAASNRLRGACGLPPVPENSVVREWRARVTRSRG